MKNKTKQNNKSPESYGDDANVGFDQFGLNVADVVITGRILTVSYQQNGSSLIKTVFSQHLIRNAVSFHLLAQHSIIFQTRTNERMILQCFLGG